MRRRQDSLDARRPRAVPPAGRGGQPRVVPDRAVHLGRRRRRPPRTGPRTSAAGARHPRRSARATAACGVAPSRSLSAAERAWRARARAADAAARRRPRRLRRGGARRSTPAWPTTWRPTAAGGCWRARRCSRTSSRASAAPTPPGARRSAASTGSPSSAATAPSPSPADLLRAGRGPPARGGAGRLPGPGDRWRPRGRPSTGRLADIEADSAAGDADRVFAGLLVLRGIGPSTAGFIILLMGHYDRPSIDSATIRVARERWFDGARPTPRQVAGASRPPGDFAGLVLAWATLRAWQRTAGLTDDWGVRRGRADGAPGRAGRPAAARRRPRCGRPPSAPRPRRGGRAAPGRRARRVSWRA